MVMQDRFPSPFDVPAPTGCEGWEELYPYHALFSEQRRDSDEGRFWFQVGMHCAEPLFPFDALILDTAVVTVSQASARLFVIPPSLGLDYRILNGYYYASWNPVDDEPTL